ncbi:16994_t:CDS:1 [Funneliformis geosporum]|uniref:16574_t:CDS:1 n=1 Tax=Funneliformis geosporum TaxID=1117311 RepID=A0A9W4SBX9_9GLOM|nr:16574_t:CDS:1 [Funneliformis geosporum]CAI2164275.1 16994_t:CDS:1 [Funneliformis geosporum]
MTSSPSSSTIKTSRACVFIDSSDPKIRNQLMMNTISHPFIKPTFPPIINLRELISKQVSADPSKNNSGRAPNAFIIYRKIFVETARKDGYQLPMTVVSLMASQSWELEPEIVKEEYKRLAKEANIIRNEIIPKSSRRRKREKWNIVSFPNNTTCKDPVVKSKSLNKKKQLTVNKIKKVEILSPSSSPVSPFEFESPKITFDIPFDIVSPIIDRFLDSDSLPDDPPQNDSPNSSDSNNNNNLTTEFNNESIIGEQNVDNSTDSLVIQRDNNIGCPYKEFEFDSQGFSSFNDNDTISYPSFWFEF